MQDDPTTTRLEAPLPEWVHTLLRQAAALQGRSISDFVVNAAREEAERVIVDHDIIKLSVSDQERFAADLLSPPPLASAIENAAALHRDLIEPA
jgi:uncharacterized protein (DUF1778 family)